MNSLLPCHSSHVSRLRLDRQQTAVRSWPYWSRPVGSVISRAQVRGRDLQADVALVLGHGVVHVVDEDDVRLAGRQPRLDQLGEQAARVDGRTDLAGLGADQLPLAPRAHRLHELVGDEHAVVEVQGLAVEVAARLPDLEEFLDLGMVDVEIDRRRAAPQRALADRQRQAVHDADEGDDAAGLAVQPDRLADAADMAPVGADAAAARGQPDVLVPGGDDVVEAVADRVQVARDRQAAPGAAVRQHRRRRHEPQLGDIVVQPLRVRGVVGVGRGDAGEQVLERLAGQQIAVAERLAAEVGQQRVAAAVDRDRESPGQDGVGGAGVGLAGRRGRVGSLTRRDLGNLRTVHRRCIAERHVLTCSIRSPAPEPTLVPDPARDAMFFLRSPGWGAAAMAETSAVLTIACVRPRITGYK